MKASEIMHRPVVAATRTATGRDVAVQLLTGEYSGVPVADADGTVIGIVTEFDLIKAVRGGTALETVLASDLMTANVTTVDVDDSFEEVMDALEANQIIRVPVTEEGKIVGIISRADILKATIEPKFLRFT